MDRFERYEAWVREVRDPAEAADEGCRVVARGRAKLDYHLARVPGGWAYKYGCTSGHSGTYVPWCGPVGTRGEALKRILEAGRERMGCYASRHNGIYEAPEDAAAVVEMLAGGGLFGFIEPDPQTDEEA